MAIDVRTCWPVSTASPKKFPVSSMPTTASLPRREITVIFTFPCRTKNTASAGSPWPNTTSASPYSVMLWPWPALAKNVSGSNLAMVTEFISTPRPVRTRRSYSPRDRLYVEINGPTRVTGGRQTRPAANVYQNSEVAPRTLWSKPGCANLKRRPSLGEDRWSPRCQARSRCLSERFRPTAWRNRQPC